MASATGEMTKEQRKRLREAYDALTRAINLCDRCVRIKADVGDRPDVIQFLISVYEAIAQEYGLTLADRPQAG